MADPNPSQARAVYDYAWKVTSGNADVDSTANAVYEERLQSTIEELESQLKKEQEALQKEEAAADKSRQISLDQASNPVTLLRQRQVITAAYKQLADAKPSLPKKDSVLPGLLALRTASQTSSEVRELIPETQADLKSARGQLEAEEKRLAAFRLLNSALAARIDELQDEIVQQRSLDAADVARARIEELKAKERNLHDEANQLGGELKWFIKEHLGPMVAADQLGGPPVGDLPEVTNEMLGAGFTDSGKPRQPKSDTHDLARKGKEHRDSVSRELRKLMQDLLNAATGDDPDATGWVEVPENSPSARYLITAKVAMFHPQDARKIRLLDFAG